MKEPWSLMKKSVGCIAKCDSFSLTLQKKLWDMNQLQKYTWLIDTIRRAGKIFAKDYERVD